MKGNENILGKFGDKVLGDIVSHKVDYRLTDMKYIISICFNDKYANRFNIAYETDESTIEAIMNGESYTYKDGKILLKKEA